MIRMYNHGESPCCEAKVLVYIRRGKLDKVRCWECRAKLDPMDVIDPSPYLMKKVYELQRV